MSKEAMKLALEAFKEIADETYDSWTNGAKAQRIAQAMIPKLEEALAKQEQEEDFFKQLGNQSMMQLWQNYCDVKVERDELQKKLAKQEQGEVEYEKK